MEELKKMLTGLLYDYYEHGANTHTIIPDADVKPILEYIRRNFVPLELLVIGANCGNCKHFQSYYDAYDEDEFEPKDQGFCKHTDTFNEGAFDCYACKNHGFSKKN